LFVFLFSANLKLQVFGNGRICCVLHGICQHTNILANKKDGVGTANEHISPLISPTDISPCGELSDDGSGGTTLPSAEWREKKKKQMVRSA
jgi:hypothetical protein